MSGRDLSCEEVIEHIFEFLDDELEPDWRADIERHIQTCRDCYTRAEFERKLREKVREAAQAKAPDRLHRRIEGLLDKYERGE